MRFALAALIILIFSNLFAQTSKKWSLQDCIDRAMEQNISIKQNELQMEQTENNLLQSKWNRAPLVNASANHNYNIGRTVDPYTNSFINRNIQSNSFSLTSSVSLFSGGRINNAIELNKMSLETARAGAEVLENQIKFSVAAAYVQILQAEENRNTAISQGELTRQQLERAEKLVKSGSENQSILLNLKAQLASDRMQIINAENAIQLAYNTMMSYLQIDVDSSFQIESIQINQIEESPVASLRDLYETALTVMPEIKKAEFQVLEARLNKKVTGAARFPSLAAYGNVNTLYSETGIKPIDMGIQIQPIGYVEGSNETVLSAIPVIAYEKNPFSQQLSDNFGRSLGLSLQVPVFANLRNSTNFQNAKLNEQIIELGLEQSKFQLRTDITTAYTNLKASKSSYDAALINVEAQELNYSFNQKRFEAGLLNATELLTAKNMWTQAQNQLTNAKYEYLFRQMILKFYTGGEISL